MKNQNLMLKIEEAINKTNLVKLQENKLVFSNICLKKAETDNPHATGKKQNK